jgi:hypothetical protein
MRELSIVPSEIMQSPEEAIDRNQSRDQQNYTKASSHTGAQTKLNRRSNLSPSENGC